MVNTPSEKQLEIIKSLKNYNVVVDSVAGSGKTTTNLHIAMHFNKKKILLLTYNAKLKIETKEKVAKLGIANLEVHTYHSFCCKYTGSSCPTDNGIIDHLNKRIGLAREINYDIILLDEAQDICPLYYKLICYVFGQNKKSARICVLGDRYQSIYGFNLADERYIIFSSELFQFNNDPWKEVHLSESFRVTKPMAEFVNEVILGYERMTSRRDGPKVRYLICDTFENSKKFAPYDEVMRYLNMGYKPDDIFILAPSMKSNRSPIIRLENRLSNKGIPIYASATDHEKLDNEILENKLVFSTFHQTKGLERKVVIVFGFDNSYFLYYKRNVPVDMCPNEIYVAITRGSERLTILHHYHNDFLPFIRQEKLEEVCDLNIYDQITPKKTEEKPYKMAVTDLIRYLPVEVINEAMSFLDIKTIRKPKKMIEIPTKISDGTLCESVSNITGIAIPAYFEYVKRKQMTIYDSITPYNKSKTKLDKFYSGEVTIHKLLRLSNIYNTQCNGYLSKYNQVKSYDWLTEKKLIKCVERMEKYISDMAMFEVECQKKLDNCDIIGYIDCADGNNYWEFKCVDEITDDHILQMAVYMYLIGNENYNYYVFNILNNHIIRIKASQECLEKMFQFILEKKYAVEYRMSDTEFTQNNTIFFHDYYIQN